MAHWVTPHVPSAKNIQKTGFFTGFEIIFSNAQRHRTTIVSSAAVFGDDVFGNDVFGNEVFFLGIGPVSEISFSSDNFRGVFIGGNFVAVWTSSLRPGGEASLRP